MPACIYLLGTGHTCQHTIFYIELSLQSSRALPFAWCLCRAAIRVLQHEKKGVRQSPQVPGKTPNGLSIDLFPTGSTIEVFPFVGECSVQLWVLFKLAICLTSVCSRQSNWYTMLLCRPVWLLFVCDMAVSQGWHCGLCLLAKQTFETGSCLTDQWMPWYAVSCVLIICPFEQAFDFLISMHDAGANVDGIRIARTMIETHNMQDSTFLQENTKT